MSPLEVIAVLLSILYILFISHERMLAWVFGLGGAVLYVFIFFAAGLYASAGLSILFAFFMLYGLLTWFQNKRAKTALRRLQFGELCLCLGLGIVFSCLIHLVCTRVFDPEFIVFDSVIAGFSCVAQFLVAKKYIDSWRFWIGINIIATCLYAVTGLYITSGLYFVYLCLAVYGLREWTRQMAEQEAV